MTDLGFVETVAQVGFPIAVSSWLLVKGYTQDQKYLEVLTKLSERMDHIESCLDRMQK